jgi:prepilin-type processing-associated H-X9-DG protein
VRVGAPRSPSCGQAASEGRRRVAWELGRGSFRLALTVDIFGGHARQGTLFYHILPYIEQDELFARSYTEPPSDPQQRYYSYMANGVYQTPVPLYICPADATVPANGFDATTEYAVSSYACNFLVFGVVNEDYEFVSSSGRASLAKSFPDGHSSTILFGEKYAMASISAQDNPSGMEIRGGTHWAGLTWDCKGGVFASYARQFNGTTYDDLTDPNSVGPIDPDDERDSRFQVRPPPDKCNPCLLSTPHVAGMNTTFADGHVATLKGAIDRFTWWALCTPAAGDYPEGEW